MAAYGEKLHKTSRSTEPGLSFFPRHNIFLGYVVSHYVFHSWDFVGKSQLIGQW